MNLREELKNLLDSTTYAALAAQEMEQAANLQQVLGRVPLGVYVGALLLFMYFPPNLIQ